MECAPTKCLQSNVRTTVCEKEWRKRRDWNPNLLVAFAILSNHQQLPSVHSLNLCPGEVSDTLSCLLTFLINLNTQVSIQFCSSSSQEEPSIYLETPGSFLFIVNKQMENQPPSGPRPWFRLASLARMEAAQAQAQAQAPTPAAAAAPAPAPAAAAPPRPPIQAPVPRIPLARILTSPIQAPPAPQLPQLPPQQQETAPRSPANGAASESRQPPRSQKSPSPPPPPSPRIPSRAPTPPESPRVIKPSSPTPPQSPRSRQLQPYVAPPSPYPEPEPKATMEPLPKSIIMQKERTKGDVKAVDSDVEAESRVEGQAPPPLPRNKTATNGRSAARKKDDDGKIKVITIAGENMGAYMELGSPHPHPKHLSGNHPNGNHQQHQGKESSSEEGNFADKKKEKEGKPMAVVINSNVQSVNNSILLSGSCSQHSPGVHFSFARHHKPQLSKGKATDSSFSKGNPHIH